MSTQLSPEAEAKRARALQVAEALSEGCQPDPEHESEDSALWDFEAEEETLEEDEGSEPGLRVGSKVVATLIVELNGTAVPVEVSATIASLWENKTHCSLRIGNVPLSRVEKTEGETPKRKRTKRKKAAEPAETAESAATVDGNEPLAHKKPKPSKAAPDSEGAAPESEGAAPEPPTAKSSKPLAADRKPNAVARIAVLPRKCTPEQAEAMVALMAQIQNARLFVAVPPCTSLPPALEPHTAIPFSAVTNSGVSRPCVRRMIDAVASALAVKTSNLLCAVAYTDSAADSDLTRRKNVQLIHPELVTKYGLETAAPKLAKIAASHAYRSLLAAPTADAPPAAAGPGRGAP